MTMRSRWTFFLAYQELRKLCGGQNDLCDSVEGNMGLDGSRVHHRPLENIAGNGMEYDLERRETSMALLMKICEA